MNATTNKTFNAATYNIENLESYNKSQLIEIINHLHARATAPRSNKKFDVLDQLRNNEALAIADIATNLNISAKNVSSLLTYLRKDGYIIHRDHLGRVYLLDRQQQVEAASNDEPAASNDEPAASNDEPAAE